MNLPKIWRLASVYASGTLVSQLLLVAALPLLARIYSPDAFGRYAAMIAIVSMVTVVSALRFEVGLHVPRMTAVAADMRRAALAGVTIASIGVACVAAIVVSLRDGAASLERIVEWCLLLPLLCCLTGAFNVSSAWAARFSRHKRVASAQIVRSAVTVSAQVAVPMLVSWRDSVALLAGALVGVVAGVGVLATAGGSVPAPRLMNRRVWLRCAAAIRRFKEFPRESAPQALLASVSNNITTILLVTFAGAQVAGYFALAERAVRAPILLVSSSLRQAFVQGLAQAQRANAATDDLARAASAKIALVLFAPVVAGFVLAPHVVNALLGAQWRESGLVIQWLLPWFWLNAIAVPFSAAMQVQRRVRGLLVLEAVLLVTKVLAIPLAAVAAGAAAAVLLGAILPSLGSLGTTLIALYAGRHLRGSARRSA